MTIRDAWLALVLVALVGCGGPQGMTMKASPINAYRSYGEYHPVAEDDALVAASESAEIAAAEIRLFQEALPAGVTMADGVLGVAPEYQHHLIGKYAYSTGGELSKDDLVARVKKMCVTVSANAAIIFFALESDTDRSRAQAIEAVLLDYHDKLDEPQP